MADSGLYSYTNFRMVMDAVADAVFRVGASVGLPLLEWLPDGSYLSYIADSEEKARNSYRLTRGLSKITDPPGFYVQAVDYEVTDRGDGEEIITLVTNIWTRKRSWPQNSLLHITSAGRWNSSSTS